MVLLAKRVSEKLVEENMTSTSATEENFLIFAKICSTRSWSNILSPCLRSNDQLPLYAVPIFIPRNRAGAAPCPVPMVCIGWPLPQLGVPQSVHWSREQIASIEFQNSVVMPEYEGFLNIRPSLPPLISQPISQPNWKL